MISFEGRQRVLVVVEEALSEVEKEIKEDRRGFFNATTSVNVVRKKINSKLMNLFGNPHSFDMKRPFTYGGRK